LTKIHEAYKIINNIINKLAWSEGNTPKKVIFLGVFLLGKIRSFPKAVSFLCW